MGLSVDALGFQARGLKSGVQGLEGLGFRV